MQEKNKKMQKIITFCRAGEVKKEWKRFFLRQRSIVAMIHCSIVAVKQKKNKEKCILAKRFFA